MVCTESNESATEANARERDDALAPGGNGKVKRYICHGIV